MAGKGSRPRPYSVSQDQFAANYDVIFGKKKKTDETVLDAYNNERLVSKYDKEDTMQVRATTEKFGSCGCGRSPTGDCCGWHGLTEDDYRAALEKYNAEQTTKDTTQGG